MKNKVVIIALFCTLIIASCGSSSKPTGDVDKDTAAVHELVIRGKYSEAKKFLEKAQGYYSGVVGEAEMAHIIEYGVGENNLFKVMSAD